MRNMPSVLEATLRGSRPYSVVHTYTVTHVHEKPDYVIVPSRASKFNLTRLSVRLT
jgi:hypothetical protein